MDNERKYARIDGDNTDRLRLARDMWREGRYDLAITYLMAIRDAGELRAFTSFTIAIASLKLKRPAAAFSMLEAAATVIGDDGPDPMALVTLPEDDPDFQFARGFVLRALGRLEEAHAALQAALKARADDPHTLYQLGLVFVAAGDQAAARNAYLRLSLLDEALARALYDQILF